MRPGGELMRWLMAVLMGTGALLWLGSALGRFLRTRSLDPADPEVQRWAAGRARPPALESMDRKELLDLLRHRFALEQFDASARRADRIWWLVTGAALAGFAQLFGSWLGFGG